MLQIEKSPPITEIRQAVAQPASQAELLAMLVSFVRRQYPIILFVSFMIAGMGVVYLFTTPPLYTGKAAMIIDTRRIQVFQQQSVLGDIAIDAAMVESQVEIMKSENVALSVIKDLHLTEDPEFVGSAGGLLGSLLHLIPSLSSSQEPKSEFDLTRSALRLFQARLNVRRIGLTYVMEITFQSHNPDRAAQIANGVADSYILDQLEAKYQTTRRAAAWLQDRLKELRADASSAERAVVDFKAKNNIIDTGGRLINEQQLAELNSALVQARAQVAEAQARLERVTQILRSDNPDPAATATGTVTDTLHNDVITKLRQTYLDYAAKESDWSRRYGPNHLAAVNLRNQMLEIRKSIIDELGRIAETYKSDFEIAKAREDSIQKGLDQIISESQSTNQAQIELRELESASQTYRALYDNFLQRYMESVQQQSFPITEARVITQATRPFEKSSPKSMLVLAVAGMGGAIFGIGIALLRDISDRVFRTGGQVEAELQTDCIAVVPLVKSLPRRTSLAAILEPNSATSPRIIKRDDSILWSVVDSPLSRFAESVRSIKVAADLAASAKPGKIIGITSSLPNEGKSTIAMALAELIAHAGSRAILVDCDLRNPSLTRKLVPAGSLGLPDVISGTATTDQIVWTDPPTGLSFLPAAAKGRLTHTSEFLASPAMKVFFDRLRTSFDYIIVDLSPLAPIVDVRTTANLIDFYVFVVEWGRTKIDVVEHVLNAAPEIYDNLIGVVLNKADTNLLSRYESYRGKSYYNRYYARYGYTE